MAHELGERDLALAAAGDDLVERHTLTPRAAGVRYTLTPYGKTLGPVFETLWRWGTSHLARTGVERGTQVVPRQLLLALLARLPKASPSHEAFGIHRV